MQFPEHFLKGCTDNLLPDIGHVIQACSRISLIAHWLVYLWAQWYLYLGKCRCPAISSLPSPSFWRPWVALDIFGIFWCWAQASSEALLGFSIILGVAYAAVRGGVYQGTTFQAPQLKLGIGLGLVCGLAGYAPRSTYAMVTYMSLYFCHPGIDLSSNMTGK